MNELLKNIRKVTITKEKPWKNMWKKLKMMRHLLKNMVIQVLMSVNNEETLME
jgi:hypothetical protein